MKIGEWITSFLAWTQIVASPFIIGAIVGFIVYIKYPTTKGLVIGIFISALGLIIGVVIASRIAKKHSTVDFISSVTASPELDNLDKEEN
ncbi:hypothetical protein [Limnovirga soli]|uniref:Uncharacterized protein n=1 Tax=Limnovirga soli TaxID=2656915 RepID=A0A8J8JUZ3_9BACT|nr:hypothetical protein [Limnovirga soli]NNV56089.1 hypothetical protein [Limnovirga soli]